MLYVPFGVLFVNFIILLLHYLMVTQSKKLWISKRYIICFFNDTFTKISMYNRFWEKTRVNICQPYLFLLVNICTLCGLYTSFQVEIKIKKVFLRNNRNWKNYERALKVIYTMISCKSHIVQNTFVLVLAQTIFVWIFLENAHVKIKFVS